MDWNHFKQTCVKAKEASIKAGKTEDGGTCNLDSVFVLLKRVREQKVLEVLKEVGLNGYKTKFLGAIGFIICPVGCGQANSRTRAMEAMIEVFRENGYDAHEYYIMD